VLNRIRGPFNLSSPAIASAAAAIEDTAHMERAKRHNDEWLPWVAGELQKLGLTVTPSVANFVLFHFKNDGGKTAADADTYLKSQGIILRKVGAYGFPSALRMTIGSENDNRRTIAALAKYLKGAA
jgi:histidinol-phosphate aminotransferase